MRTRSFGPLGSVSALTLGGGGIGGVWGVTDRSEAIATVRAAVAAGITLLDVAPSYGTRTEPRRAELVIGEAFEGKLPAPVRIVTKVVVEDSDDVRGTIRKSLEASLNAMRVNRVDVLLHHCDLRPDRIPPRASTLGLPIYREQLRKELAELRSEQLIGAWGLTATGHPEAVAIALTEEPQPQVIQTVTNLLDSPGSLWNFDGRERPDFAGTRRLAAANGIATMGIRAAQGGALTDAAEASLQRIEERLDHRRARRFRELAARRSESSARLAHRYALALDSVDTVVLGVKNRLELADCLAAEAAPPLSEEELSAIRSSVHTLFP
jgi:aryl-alcohol dehydrogenase-like predicted oxidoreductase